MFVYKVSTSSELVCASYDHIYVSNIIYCLRPFVVAYKHVILLYFMLMNNICVQSSTSSYDHIYVSIYVLPEAVCCCLQTCNFIVIFMLMNNVCEQDFNFI